jgi:Na+/H+ antiporter NhaC
MDEHRLPGWARWVLAAVLLIGAWAGLSRMDRQAEIATLDALVLGARADLESALPEAHVPHEGAYDAVLVLEGDAARHRYRIVGHLEASEILRLSDTRHTLRIHLDLSATPPAIEMRYAEGSPAPVVVSQTRTPISGASLYPALLAIVLAFATGRVVLSLWAAIVLGALLSAGMNPVAFVPHAATDYFWKATLTDAFKLWIVVFTCGLLGLVRLAVRAGGVQGVVRRIAGQIRGPRSAQRATAGMGLAVFFDDYANTVLVGSTMRRITDRLRIAREKLAYLVDSTAAPIAGVALISTWIGYEIALLSDAAGGVGMAEDGYGLFLYALPFRFYCLFTLAFVAILVITGRDFGPMLRAERRAAKDGLVIRPGSRPLSGRDHDDPSNRAAPGIPHLAHVAVLPIAVVVTGTILGLFLDGGGAAGLFSFAAWREAFGDAENGTFVMAMATVAGSAVLFALVLGRRLLSATEAVRAYGKGVWSMGLAVVILVLAWAIKAVCDDLGADRFLVAALGDSVPPLVVPLVVFLLAAVVAFSTGTSWGTMAILIPVAVPLSFHVGGAALTFVTMAAVLDGAIFGDHCSPISDTTVMSSIATGCDHMDHVRTQVPYALTTMTAAALFGYLWNGLGLPWWAGMVVGLGLLALAVRLLGRDARAGLPQITLDPGDDGDAGVATAVEAAAETAARSAP